MSVNKDVMRDEVVLPYRAFMYTLDQICYMLDVREKFFMDTYVYYQGRDSGPLRRKIVAVNLADPDDEPIWRVPEENYIEWLKRSGIKIIEARKPIRRAKRGGKLSRKEVG